MSWRSRLRMTQKQQIRKFSGSSPITKHKAKVDIGILNVTMITIIFSKTNCIFNHFSHCNQHRIVIIKFKLGKHVYFFNWFPTVFLTTESSFRIASETQRTFFLILLFFFTEERFHSSVQHKDLGFRQSIQKEVLQGLKITITYAVPKEVFSGIC